jgi:hypothetical protein
MRRLGTARRAQKVFLFGPAVWLSPLLLGDPHQPDHASLRMRYQAQRATPNSKVTFVAKSEDVCFLLVECFTHFL